MIHLYDRHLDTSPLCSARIENTPCAPNGVPRRVIHAEKRTADPLFAESKATVGGFTLQAVAIAISSTYLLIERFVFNLFGTHSRLNGDGLQNFDC